MRDKMELNDVARGVRRRWWIPALLGLVGVNVGVVAAMQVPAVHRSEATLLVGPTDGEVTYSSTIRASENQAAFYADMARRQVVLQPVVQTLGLRKSWDDLRDDVSAVVPTQNLRLVTVTVLGDTQAETERAANAIVEQLVSLSPAPPNGTEREFVAEQIDELKHSIQSTQRRIEKLTSEIDQTSGESTRDDLQRQVDKLQTAVGEWQRTYVDLVSSEPSSDAGGLQVLDQATPVTSKSRAGQIKQGFVGGFAGVTLGMLCAWLLHRRLRRGPPGDTGGSPAGPEPSEGVGLRPPSAARNGSAEVTKELLATGRPVGGRRKGAGR